MCTTVQCISCVRGSVALLKAGEGPLGTLITCENECQKALQKGSRCVVVTACARALRGVLSKLTYLYGCCCCCYSVPRVVSWCLVSSGFRAVALLFVAATAAATADDAATNSVAGDVL
jgi:hypothetical protein